jgi:hypothetical protein
MRLPTVVLLVLLALPANATEVNIVAWNCETMFDAPTVVARSDDLRNFGQYYERADIVILTEVTSLEVVNAIRDRMGLLGFHTVCSNFAPDDFDQYNSFEVGVISRFPLSNAVEYDPTPDFKGRPNEPREERLTNDLASSALRLESSAGLRGFLAVDVPALHLTLAFTHLKSSRGASGESDHDNARLREFVATSMVRFAAGRLSQDPNSTVLIAGDMNVGETDRAKLGFRLDEDHYDYRAGDLYDDTHAIFSQGLVAGLHMASLTKGLGTETYDDTRFQGAGPIDCMYVAGRRAGQFTLASRSSDTFGSDHFAISTTLYHRGELPDTPQVEVDAPPSPAPPPKVRITAALPNPHGDDGGHEWVELSNTTDREISLAGWRLRDKAGNQLQLDQVIPSGGRLRIQLAKDQVPLNNSGDTIELLDDQSQLIHRARYSGRLVSPGAVIPFE